MGHTHAKHAKAPAPPKEPTKSQRGSVAKRVRRAHDSDHHRGISAKHVEDKYEIDPKVLGRGHYGVVRRCACRKTGESCAVKAISKARLHRPEVLDREITILRTLKHPNIVEIKDVFEDAHHVFIVTELLGGGELFDHIIAKTNTKAGHYGEAEAAAIVRQILGAIAYCHAHHVVHRDLKPENFLFTCADEARARLKVIDFGLATEEHVSEGTVARLHTRVGTPYYIAPEVLSRDYSSACDLWSIGAIRRRGESPGPGFVSSTRGDVWSSSELERPHSAKTSGGLGVIAYILLCGYPPFGGDSDAEIFGQIKRGLSPRAFPAEDWGGASPEALGFIKNLLDPQPGERMTAAAALDHAWLRAPAAARPARPPRLSGNQLAARIRRFVGMNRLRKTALNVLAHHLTEREIAELSKVWSQLDADSTGVLTVVQLHASLEAHGHHTTSSEMAAFASGLDLNDDHVIDYYEFAAAMLSRNQTIRDDRLKEVFEAMDAGTKGFVTVADLERIMGSRAHAEEVMGDLHEAVGENGRLTFDVLKQQLDKLPTQSASSSLGFVARPPKPPAAAPAGL